MSNVIDLVKLSENRANIRCSYDEFSKLMEMLTPLNFSWANGNKPGDYNPYKETTYIPKEDDVIVKLRNHFNGKVNVILFDSVSSNIESIPFNAI